MPDTQSTEKPLRNIVDSTIAITFARFFMPIALAVIGWFMITTINDFKDKNLEMWKYVGKLGDVTAVHSTDIASIKARIDEQGKSLDRIITIIDSGKGH